MRRPYRTAARRLLLVAGAGLGLLATASCTPEASISRPVLAEKSPVSIEQIEQSIEVPDGTPEELAAVMEKAWQEVAEAPQEDAAGGHGAPGTADESLRPVLTGIKAAEKLADHPDAGEKARRLARQTKLMLLYVGAQKDREALQRRFLDYAEKLIAESPSSDAAALAAACRLEWQHLLGDEIQEDVLPLLVDYAKAYPASPAGIDLFGTYGRKLESNRDRAGAMQCYRTALDLYGRTAQTRPLAGRLDELARAEAQRAADRAAAAARKAETMRRLGGHHDGYYVFYAEEHPSGPRRGLIYFYHYEYEVVHGRPAAACYVDNLPDRWTWELKRWFPETDEGRKQAFALRQDLLENKNGRKKK